MPKWHEKFIAVNIIGAGRGLRTGMESVMGNAAAKDKPCEEISASEKKYKAETLMLQGKHRVVRWTRPLPKQDEADGYNGAAKLRSERQNAKSAEEQMELPKISLTKGNYSRNHHAFVSSLSYPSSSSGTKKWSMCSSRGSRHSRVYRLQSKSGRRKAELGRYLPPPLIKSF